MIFVGHKNIKERVNFINFKRKLGSVHFDGSCQNSAFIYFKILPMLIEFRILKVGSAGIL